MLDAKKTYMKEVISKYNDDTNTKKDDVKKVIDFMDNQIQKD